MKVTIFALALFPYLAEASVLKLTCEIRHNYDVVFQHEVRLEQGQKNVSVGSFDNFELLVSSLEESWVELQLYDLSEPSRTYAVADLSGEKGSVDLSIWKRDFLLEASCRK